MASMFPILPPALDAPGRAAALVAVCERHGVARLDLFGSATTAAFDPARSDVDLLVEFVPDPPHHHFVAYFDLKDALEALFGRPVDLIQGTADEIANPYLKSAILRQKRPLYVS